MSRLVYLAAKTVAKDFSHRHLTKGYLSEEVVYSFYGKWQWQLQVDGQGIAGISDSLGIVPV